MMNLFHIIIRTRKDSITVFMVEIVFNVIFQLCMHSASVWSDWLRKNSYHDRTTSTGKNSETSPILQSVLRWKMVEYQIATRGLVTLSKEKNSSIMNYCWN